MIMAAKKGTRLIRIPNMARLSAGGGAPMINTMAGAAGGGWMDGCWRPQPGNWCHEDDAVNHCSYRD